jgi:hypothetical protein
MPNTSLWDVFVTLPPEPNEFQADGEHFAARVEAFEGLHVGKDARQRPVLFIEVRDSSQARAVQLQNVWITHSVTVTVDAGEGTRRRMTSSLLGCSSDAASLHRLFLDCVATLIPPTVESRTGAWLTALVNQLVELFIAGNLSGKTQSTGLWGELLTIAVSRNPVRMVEAWHDRLDERFDFSWGCSRLEVKTTTLRDRKHSISFAQANPGPDLEATVVSVTTEPSHGLAISTLRQHCIDLMEHRHDLMAKIDRICAEYLGQRWATEMETSYDLEVALGTIAVFDVENIPRLPAPLPCGVVDARFTTVLSFCEPLRSGAKDDESLAAALLPWDAHAVDMLQQRCREAARYSSRT